MKVLVVDVGGTHVKVLDTGQSEPRKFDSGSNLTAERMVAGVKKHTTDWTYEDYVGVRGLERVGKKKWRRYVADVVARLVAALEPEDVVLGGGNAKELKEMPPDCRAGKNDNAFLGGFRLWEDRSNYKPAKPARIGSR
jgi:hypothetical protein